MVLDSMADIRNGNQFAARSHAESRGEIPQPPKAPPLEVWKFNRQVRSLPAGGILRIQAAFPFRLRWTYDEWRQAHDTNSAPIGTGHEYADIPVSMEQRAPVRFTFFWITEGRWEGRDFQVDIHEAGKGVPLP